MDVFGKQRIAHLEQALRIAQSQISQLREENRRLLCKINPHLESVFFPDARGLAGIPASDDIEPTATSGPYLGIQRCSLQLSDKKVRFCATHQQDLDSKGRCPVTEVTLFRNKTSPLTGKGRRILGSEFCRAKDEKFSDKES